MVEEVASLAGVSVEYYKRLERGNAAGVSDGVADALADALQLDDAERAHLFDLARAASPVATRRARRASAQKIRPVVQRIVDTIGSPAAISNMRGDYLTANALGRALYAPLFESREQSPNAARFTFLDPRRSSSSSTGRRRPRTWSRRCARKRAATRTTVPSAISSASCRPAASHSDSVGFPQRPLSPEGRKRLHHPVVGDLELDYEVMELSADSGLRLAVFSAEPGTRSAEALDLLASWTARSAVTAAGGP